MAERLTRQLSLHRELKGERCPGETVCAERGPLFKYRGRPAEQVCAGCNLRHTKPEASPLNQAQNVALELEELHACGATFAYPEALTTYEWACLRSLHRARQEDNEKQRRKEEAADKKRQAEAKRK